MSADVQPTPQSDPNPRAIPVWIYLFGTAVIALTAAFVAWEIRRQMGEPVAATPGPTPPTVARPLHPVEIRRPAGPPAVRTQLVTTLGQPVDLACASCHAITRPNQAARLGTPLAAFHQGLTGKHGDLACVACHNPGDAYASLHLADGSRVAYPDVMRLCAQCHGQQYRDYEHGAHGGMTGYWDRTRGPRQRNNCIDCHDPHAPKYPAVRPAPGPIDRGPGAGRQHQQGVGHE